ncbi:MAG: ATP-dependent DNA helicase, partial [Bacteroidota bacterium]|nr:ATP-dependent DNA helicase [Bacteroidota bacterium]
MKKIITDSYKQALAKCNTEQLEAINSIEGVVLVIAGPGTGKTQILSLRIGKILEQTDVFPENILCLTYTEAGTVAMRKRLQEFIGPEAYRVNIHTFHSFCNSVIKENRTFFGHFTAFEPISELENVQLFRKMIDSFPKNHVLKRYTGDSYYEAQRLKILFDTIKKEHFEIAELVRKANEYLKILPELPEFQYKKANASKNIKKGDPNSRLIAIEADHIEKFITAVGEFDNYTQLMNQMNRFDFNDMINWVIDAFQQNENLLAQYQEKYLYILVDEFQDTNGSQNTILNLLTDFWENPNLFVVGDDDQSIYSFQGAEISRIEAFVHKYKSVLKPIVLTQNYRSIQEVLTASAVIIDANNNRIINNHNLISIFRKSHIKELTKNIVSSNGKYQLINSLFESNRTLNSVTISEYYNTYHEEASIVKHIEELLKSGTNLSETAIIYRNHSQIDNICKVLDHRKIPYNARQKVNVLDIPLIKNIVTLMKYLSIEQKEPFTADDLLFEILHFPFFNVNYKDIQKLVYHTKKETGKLRQNIDNKGLMLQLGLERASSLSSLNDHLNFWQSSMPNLTLQELFEKILYRGGIIAYVMQLENKMWYLEAITALFDHIKEETSRNSHIQLSDWVNTIELMIESEIGIPLNKISNPGSGVNLVTAHSAKGLEFEHVFMLGCTADKWEKQKSSNRGYKFPLLDTEHSDQEHNPEEEERRLFYVAMTRAKEHLYISYPGMKISDKSEDNPTIVKSTFVAELENHFQIAPNKIICDDDTLLQYSVQSLQPNEVPDSVLIESNYVKESLKNYKLSVTHLNKYLKCPLSFYYENVLQVPTARTASAGFGNAIHECLNKLFVQMKLQEGIFPSVDQFLGYFRTSMNKYKSHFTEVEWKLKMEYGEILLPKYYNKYVHTWNKITTTEYRPSSVFENIPLSGALDKIEFRGKIANVVDYKTGDPDKTKKKLKPPKPGADAEIDSFEDVYGGDYWRQLVFYKILLDNDKNKDWHMETGEIDFVLMNKDDEFVTSGPILIQDIEEDIV